MSGLASIDYPLVWYCQCIFHCALVDVEMGQYDDVVVRTAPHGKNVLALSLLTDGGFSVQSLCVLSVLSEWFSSRSAKT